MCVSLLYCTKLHLYITWNHVHTDSTQYNCNMYIHPCDSCKFVYRVDTYNIEQFNILTSTTQYKTQYNNFTEYVTYNTAAADTITNL